MTYTKEWNGTKVSLVVSLPNRFELQIDGSTQDFCEGLKGGKTLRNYRYITCA